MTWGEAFLWTCALETPVYALLLRRSFHKRRYDVPPTSYDVPPTSYAAWAAAVTVGIFLQLLTHPALWWLWPLDWPYWHAFFVGETAVVLVEGAAVALLLLLLRERRPILRGFAIALLANTISASIGLLF